MSKMRYVGLYADVNGKIVVHASGEVYHKVSFRKVYPGKPGKYSMLNPKMFTEKYPHKIVGVVLEES